MQQLNTRLSWAVGATVTGLFALAAGTAVAADWSVDPRITLDAESDDNKRLSPVPAEEISVFGAALDARVSFRAETPRSTFFFVPRLRSTFYPGDEEVETDNQYARLGFDTRGERSRAGFEVEYARRETLGRFFPEPGVDDDDDLGEPDPGDDIGVSTLQNRQEQLRIQPAVDFELTERVGLGFDLGYLDVTYDEQVLDDREDYSNIYGGMRLGFRLSPTRALTVGAEASSYEPDDGESTNSQALTLEWSNQVTEISRVYVRGGASRVESNIPGESSWNTGFTGGAGVRWAFEVTEVFLDATRELDPNSSGRIVERDQLRFQLARRMSPVTTLFLAARGIRDGSSDDDATFQEREYAAASIRFEWRFARQWALGGGYEYAWRSVEDAVDDADANRFHVGITYEPNRQ